MPERRRLAILPFDARPVPGATMADGLPAKAWTTVRSPSPASLE
jgi:hypothetical protein